MTLDEAISSMSNNRVKPDIQMLYYCLRLDNSKLSLKQVNDLIDGKLVSITIKDIVKLFVYRNVIANHIIKDSGYNICTELIRAMVLGTQGTMGFTNDVLNITDDLIYDLKLAIKFTDPFEKAARIYTVITEHAVVKEHSKAIGYLMMVYYLKEDGYGLFVPDDDFISELLENNSMCTDDITRQLKMYLTVDITDDFVEKAIDIARTPVMHDVYSHGGESHE